MVRRCQVCRGQLNSYNSGKLCFPCQKKQNEEQVEKLADTTHHWPEIVCVSSRIPALSRFNSSILRPLAEKWGGDARFKG
jgi:hypothetical protein